MKKDYYLPTGFSEKGEWLQNFSSKLPGYAGKYGITGDETDNTAAGSLYFRYWLDYRNQYNEYLKKLTAWRNELVSGSIEETSVPPAPPVTGAAPPDVQPGIFKRATAIVATIKSRTNFSEADGQDLGIIGSEAAAQEQKPVISLRLVNGGHPEVMWKKFGFGGVDIYVNRGNGQWVFLATDTNPNYTDTAPLPTAGQSALWKYKTIYRVADDQVGEFSDEVSISVSGTV